MDIAKEAEALMEKHARKSERLTPILRGTARDHYRMGVQDCLRVMQQAAFRDEVASEIITAPSAVQPTHAAEESKDAISE